MAAISDRLIRRRRAVWLPHVVLLSAAIMPAGQRFASATVPPILGESGAQPEDVDPMSHVIRLMEETGTRLDQDLDPGPQTQAMQQRILERLDDAIAAALRQRSQGAPEQQPAAEEREMPELAEKPPPPRPDAEPADPQPGAGGARGTVASAPGKTPTGPLQESRRGWGHLPARDREEIIQSIEERVLDAYRDLADNYYRTLAATENDAHAPTAPHD